MTVELHGLNEKLLGVARTSMRDAKLAFSGDNVVIEGESFTDASTTGAHLAMKILSQGPIPEVKVIVALGPQGASLYAARKKDPIRREGPYVFFSSTYRTPEEQEEFHDALGTFREMTRTYPILAAREGRRDQSVEELPAEQWDIEVPFARWRGVFEDLCKRVA